MWPKQRRGALSWGFVEGQQDNGVPLSEMARGKRRAPRGQRRGDALKLLDILEVLEPLLAWWTCEEVPRLVESGRHLIPLAAEQFCCSSCSLTGSHSSLLSALGPRNARFWAVCCACSSKCLWVAYISSRQAERHVLKLNIRGLSFPTASPVGSSQNKIRKPSTREED